MTERRRYLERLERELSFLPPDERQEAVGRMESRIALLAARHDGLTEAELVYALAAPELVAAYFRYETRGTPERPRDPEGRRKPFADFLRRFGTSGDVERTLSGNLAVAAGTTVLIRFPESDISVERGPPGELSWKIHVLGDIDEAYDYAPSMKSAGRVLVIDSGESLPFDISVESAEFLIPEGLDSTIVETLFGDAEVIGLDHPFFATTDSGSVLVERMDGNVFVESISGSIEAEALRGNLTAISVSGDIRASRIRGAVNARTVSGSIDARGGEGFVEAETSSGDVFLDLGTDESGASVSTSSGNVRAVIDPETNLTLDAESSLGQIDFRFGSEETRSARRVARVLGSGTGSLFLRSGSGRIVIEISA
jgi:hypothetical protein